MFKQYTKKENTIIILIIIGFLFLTSAPFLIGYLIAGKDYFLGGSYLSQQDVNVYVSYIEQAKEGKFLFSNLFTSEPQKGLFFGPLWLVLGWLAKFLNLNGLLVFHLARIILGFFFLLFIFYYFLNIFFKKFFDKLVAFLLICFPTGLGFLFNHNLKDLINKGASFKVFLPADLFLPETNTFLSLSYSALFIVAQLFVLLIFYIFLKKDTQKINYFYLFAISLILGFIHPFDVVVVLAVLLTYFIISLILKDLKLIENTKAYIIKYLFLAIGFLSALLYFYFVVRPEAAIWGWFRQNVTLSPPLAGYLVAYAVLIFFSLISVYLMVKKNVKAVCFLLCWIITLAYLIYSPLPFQNRFIDTMQIALSLLAAYSLAIMASKIMQSKLYLKILALGLFLILIVLANGAFLVTEIYAYNTLAGYFYFPSSYYQAALWLKNNSQDDEPILAEALNGQALPAIIARPVYIGHHIQTLDWQRKILLLNEWFFKDNNQDVFKKEFLKANNLKYIFYTKREQSLGTYNLDKADFLEKVYINDEVKIYKVIN